MSPVGADRRARLEESRDFLLSSIDDLELEYGAGDIDEVDYRALNADYTARAAHVIRVLADDDEAVAPSPAAAVGGRLAWILGVVLVAAVAGVLVAQFSGSRSSGDSITGGIRTTSREMLFDAQQAFAEGDAARALAIYELSGTCSRRTVCWSTAGSGCSWRRGTLQTSTPCGPRFAPWQTRR